MTPSLRDRYDQRLGPIGPSGPVDVLGVSTDGSIAQQLAVDHPRSVRLLLVSTGCRLSTSTQRMQARVVHHIRAGDRDQALAAMLFGASFPRAQPLAPPLAPLAARVGRKPGDLDDLATTIVAGDEINLASIGTSIVAPTLIVAGARDRFYPRPLLEEKQRLIPGSVLHLSPRPGHLTAMTATGIPAAGGHTFSGRDRSATPTRGPETAGERGPLTQSPNAGRCTAERTTGIGAPTDSSGSPNLAGWTRSAVPTGWPLAVSMSSSRNLPPIVQP